MMPSHLGNYKLSGVVGYGGMGVVYRAEQSLTRCISIIEGMVEADTARSYNTALMNDMANILRDVQAAQVKSKRNAE